MKRSKQTGILFSIKYNWSVVGQPNDFYVFMYNEDGFGRWSKRLSHSDASSYYAKFLKADKEEFKALIKEVFDRFGDYEIKPCTGEMK